MGGDSGFDLRIFTASIDASLAQLDTMAQTIGHHDRANLAHLFDSPGVATHPAPACTKH